MIEYRNRLEYMKGQRDACDTRLTKWQEEMVDEQDRLENLEKAQAVLQAVAQQTQEALSYHVAELVSLALEAVFPLPYTFKVEFVQKRGKTEADLLFERDGMVRDPIDDTGGGVVDVAAFALRVSLWSLQKYKTRPIIILDEPFRFVSANLQPKAIEMLQEISAKLGIQFIIVTHEDEIMEGADKVFKVTNKNGTSRVKEIA